MAQIPITWDGLDAQGNPLRWDDESLTWDGFLPEPATKRMSQLRVQLGFTNAPDQGLLDTTESVLTNLYGKPAYPTPPVTQAALTAARDAFLLAIGVAAQGGTAATADKANKRDTLVGLLRQLAGYVQEKHGNNLATLLSSGFDAVSTNRAQQPLEKPQIREILNGNSGQLIVRVGAVKNAKNYEVRYAAVAPGGAPGPWQGGGLFSNSRSMPISGLTPGTNYMIEVRAIGGSTGYSDWSDPSSHMSM